MTSSTVLRTALRHAIARPATRVPRIGRRPLQSQWVRYASSGGRSRNSGGRMLGLAAVAVAASAVVLAWPILTKEPAAGPEKAEVVFEKPRRQPASKEDNRDLVSSQHLQVKKSWEHPGVYAWGSNVGKVVAPESNEAVVKTPRRIPYFDGQLLRDIKMDRYFGAALTENGDLVQWGTAFSEENPTPTVTLRGKDLVKLAISRDRVIALSSSGSVFSLPVSGSDQQSGAKETSTSWIPYWSSLSPVSYRTLRPQNLGWGEKVVDVSSGLEHALMLTSQGRLFSFASSTEDFPSKGQLGIPGLTWITRPKGPYDQPHELLTLRGFNIVKIATGDHHSLVLDRDGRLFSFGDNSAGQLGFEPDLELSHVDAPSLLPVSRLYNGTGLRPRVTSIAAGGSNSFFTVDATKVQGQDDFAKLNIAPDRDVGKVTAETWACGEGLYGSLGTGRWTHISTAPTKIKALSNIFEWDEAANKSVPIRMAAISVGSTHASAIMDNVTYLSASNKTSEHDCNWGADIVWWGGNEHYQLGTGKRSNSNIPLYIGPLDGGRGDAEKGRKGEVHRFQITPRKTVRLGEDGKGRRVSVEQRVECGRFVTAVYSGV